MIKVHIFFKMNRENGESYNNISKKMFLSVIRIKAFCKYGK